MKHLAKRRDIAITTADKGGAVAITETENYTNKINHQLSNKKDNFKWILLYNTRK